jgi:hypothetical protein
LKTDFCFVLVSALNHQRLFDPLDVWLIGGVSSTVFRDDRKFPVLSEMEIVKMVAGAAQPKMLNSKSVQIVVHYSDDPAVPKIMKSRTAARVETFGDHVLPQLMRMTILPTQLPMFKGRAHRVGGRKRRRGSGTSATGLAFPSEGPVRVNAPTALIFGACPA